MGRNPLGCSKARYYNPNIGRFLSEDPLRFKSGINFYSYVLNMPISLIDPSGLFSISSGDCGCYSASGGPPPAGGGGGNLKDVLEKEGKEACLIRMLEITDAKLRTCVMIMCETAKVKCIDCNDSNKAGEAIMLDPKAEVSICRDSWRNYNGGNGYGPGAVGRLLIHEFAHLCGWRDCGGGDVPDNRKESDNCKGPNMPH